MDSIEKIVYINLLHREDRKKEIQEEFQKYDYSNICLLYYSLVKTKRLVQTVIETYA